MMTPPQAISPHPKGSFPKVQNGSVEGALSGRPPMPGRPAVRLDWRTRIEVARTAARGLADLQRASLDNTAAPVTPSNMLLSEAAAPRLQPPNMLKLAIAPPVKCLDCLPEKRKQNADLTSVLMAFGRI